MVIVNFGFRKLKLPDNMLTIEKIKEVIEKLPHSKGRVPYTYHHDYLRIHSKKFSSLSRSHVARENKESDLELYVVSLVQLLDELGSKGFDYIDSSDVEVCKKVRQVTKKVIERYG